MTRALPLFLLSIGCAPDGVRPDAPCPPSFAQTPYGCAFDEDTLAELVRTFDQGQLVKVNARTFDQTLGIDIRRNVWVSPLPVDGTAHNAAGMYAGVDPEAGEVVLPAAFPVGTTIVHEAVDREEGHGVLVKREAGFDPDRGDWAFAKIFDDGAPDENPCGPCDYCHGSRPGTMLWGVPADSL